jgi:phage terminase large subunit-like protein
MDLEFPLHVSQREIFTGPQRFKVVGAGRRFGKSYLARVKLIVNALQMKNDAGYDLTGTAVYYIAPTFNQAKDIMWQELKRMARPVTKKIRENECIITLLNDRQIHLKGSDRPDTLRGVGLSYVVMDEYAFMKEEVWTAIIRPVLADVKGGALFIGTPNGKNHFYDLFMQAVEGGDSGEWGAWTFTSLDNPFIDPAEIYSASKDMPLEYVKQEFEANFSSFGGTVFQADLLKTSENHEQGEVYMTVDPAGYEDVTSIAKGHQKRLDETAISIVKTGSFGWHVLDVLTGRWGVRETAIHILREAQKHKPVSVGIEKGALRNALLPYLHDNMRRMNVYPPLTEVSHGNKKKSDRIVWALQGRLQQGRLTFAPGQYTKKLFDQFLDFPNPMAHDDMIDSLAYVDQLSSTMYDVSLDDYGSSSIYNPDSRPRHNIGQNHIWQPMDDQVTMF